MPGAKEYIPLPPDPELIAAVLAAVADDHRDFIYRDDAMAQVVKLAQQIAPSDASVLITGESGTGKEVLARFVHAKSNRARAPFISVNCAAIPEHLLESELFGHEKGSFTGAVARRIGKFEEATGGTLLLDEISEMDVRLQAKLLRAIQERVIDRVGGAKPVPVDIRIIATSNRNLAEAVKAGTFREDLLYRLNVVNLKIPPLRERPADVLELADHFVKMYAKANGMARVLSTEARAQLIANRWPGNVRELENAMHRAVLIARERGDRAGGDHRAGRRAARGAARRARRRACDLRGRDGDARAGRPHGRRRRARPDPRDAEALPRQPHACGQHPRHLDPHAAQQAQRIRRRRRRDPAARQWRGRFPDGGVHCHPPPERILQNGFSDSRAASTRVIPISRSMMVVEAAASASRWRARARSSVATAPRRRRSGDEPRSGALAAPGRIGFGGR